MKYFHLDGIINEELLNKYIQFRNENISDHWTIVLNSGGGKSNLMHVILDDINDRVSNTGFRVVLISCGIYSASFVLFYYAKCEKKMTQGSIGMIHLSSNDVTMQSHCKPEYSEGENTIQNWKETAKEIEFFVEKFMTPSEIKKYKKGNDIYFTFKRMREIFPDAQII